MREIAMACPRARAHALVGKCPRFGVGANKEMGDRDLVALAFPLELKVPNTLTRAAMEEARAMAKARTARFDSADALIDDLEEAGQQ